MKSIAFTHYKGGTGKTTSCINIAAFLAQAGEKVLVVDLDPQGNATAGLGIDKKTLEASIAGIFQGSPIREIILETELNNLHLAPAAMDLAGIEHLLYGEGGKIGILSNALKEVAGFYDFVLIDTPPSFGPLIANGIAAADNVIACFDIGVFGLEGMRELNNLFAMIETETGKKNSIFGAILGKCPLSPLDRFFSLFNANPLKEIEPELKKRFNGKVYLVPFSNKVFESHKKGIPLSVLYPESPVGISFRKIADEVLVYG